MIALNNKWKRGYSDVIEGKAVEWIRFYYFWPRGNLSVFFWPKWIEILCVENKREVCYKAKNTSPKRQGAPKCFSPQTIV